ncbi:UDP-2,4-diacetamido-2,4,6-trideoxy-beta-L-altropyranose hydrolase [Dongia sp.]|uniref:UDP-2,4-diacetamido-2,4, 6-trideoxy-beta-L-altropyranose hydrolase n=1 Tax=Dongia sp. TaxID=1977262 RepID=UPI0035B09205
MIHSVSVVRITDNPIATLVSVTQDIPEEIEQTATTIWQGESERRGGDLFNGEIVSVTSINGSKISGRRAEYRWLLAQSRDPSVFQWSQVRPLAVTGLLLCREGIVIGLRSRSVYQFPGLWELAPSGSVDLSTYDQSGAINLQKQLMQELREEIGIEESSVTAVRPLAIASDAHSNVFDVCFKVETDLSWSEIQAISASKASDEYDSLSLLSLEDVPEFIAKNKASITPLTMALLQMTINERVMAALPSGTPQANAKKPCTAIIVQARMGSSRLPGKIVEEIGGRAVLSHVIQRLQAVKNADVVVIATTDQTSDDPIVQLAQKCGAVVFRGDEKDVLSRYLGAARMVDADVILRVTSDCPLIDPWVCEKVIKAREQQDADYAANNMPRLFPHGLDCEAFTRDVLEQAASEATEGYDREHVTPWMRRSPDLRRVNVIGPGWPANQQRWTLDYPEDLTFFRQLFANLPSDKIPTWQDALSRINEIPGLAVTNIRHRVGSAMANDPGTRTVIFRTVADEKIGTGHAMRCHALWMRLESLGWRCLLAADEKSCEFLGSTVPARVQIRLQGQDAQDHAAQIAASAGACDVLIIDDYAVTSEFATAARRFAARIVYFDDLADRALDADVIVNPTPGDWNARYASLNGKRKAHLLLGPDAALLRQQFMGRRAQQQQAVESKDKKSVSRVLIAFGGVDPLDGTGLALDVLKDMPGLSVDVVLGSQAPHIERVRSQIAACNGRARLLTDVADMAGLMASADLAIGAPGTSAWERSCIGLPSILVGIAENQRFNAQVIEQAGAGLLAGFLTTEARADVAKKLAAHLTNLHASPDLQRRMAQAAFDICDGRGTQRITVALLSAPTLRDGRKLDLRVVEARDEQMLMEMQRVPETRRYALNPAIPTAEEHHRWLMERLSAIADWFLIAEVDGQPAAFVRLDWIGEDNGRPEFLISIATERSYHRRGVGAALLKAVRQLAPGAHFYAKILPDNLASLALFIRADYQLAADGYFHSYPSQRKED